MDGATWKTVEPLGWSSMRTPTAASRSGTRPGTTGKRKGNIDVQDRLPGYVFSPEEVWTGLVVPIRGKSTKVCKGLLDDWSSWIREKGENASRMAEVVGTLTVRGEPWEVGPILRLSVDDAQDVPIDQDRIFRRRTDRARVVSGPQDCRSRLHARVVLE